MPLSQHTGSNSANHQPSLRRVDPESHRNATPTTHHRTPHHHDTDSPHPRAPATTVGRRVTGSRSGRRTAVHTARHLAPHAHLAAANTIWPTCAGRGPRMSQQSPRPWEACRRASYNTRRGTEPPTPGSNADPHLNHSLKSPYPPWPRTHGHSLPRETLHLATLTRGARVASPAPPC